MIRTRCSPAWLAAFGLAACASGPQVTRGEPHSIRSAEFITDYSKDVAPGNGGIDLNVDAGRFFLPSLADCREIVRRTARSWATEQKLFVIREDDKAGRYMIHLGRKDVAGFFEVLYRLAADKRRATMEVLYYSPSGVPAPPDYFGVETSHVSEALLQAVGCKPEASH